MDVSVIIISWNTKDLLRNCIKSVYEQAGDVAYEVIVVDNASSDGSVEMVHCEFPQARLIVEESNLGYAGAINDGIAASSGKYVLVLNSDTLICDSAIEKTVHYADRHPEAAVVGCQVFGERGMLGMSCFRFPSLLNLALETFGFSKIFRNNSFFGRERMPEWARDSEREVEVITGVFMLVRREAVDEVGLMDEAFFFLFEETDWCYRFFKAGWKMLFWPGAKIIHVHGGGQSQKKAGVKIAVQYCKSMSMFFRKHHSRAVYFLARALLLVHNGLRCLVWGIARLYQGLAGRDAQYAGEKTRGYWWSFWFCILGIEPGGRGLGWVIQRTANEVRSGVKILFAFVCWVFSFLRRRVPARVALYYHAVKKQEIVCFENQMKYLAKHCRVVRASDVMTAPLDGAKPVVAVIFDDAFTSFQANALPVLRHYGLTAAVAVPVGLLGKSPNWLMDADCDDRDEIVLDAKAVAELDRLGYEILSHTISHRDLTRLGSSELETELCESKHRLEQILGHEVDGIAYPYGACNTTICEAAGKAGYRLGFSVEPRTGCQSTNALCIGRFEVSPNECMFGFKLKAQGAYQAVHLLGRLKHMLTRCCPTHKRGL